MTLTEKLKTWLIANKDIESGANDDKFKKDAGDALATGDLSTAKFGELCTDESDHKAHEVAEKQDKLTNTQTAPFFPFGTTLCLYCSKPQLHPVRVARGAVLLLYR